MRNCFVLLLKECYYFILNCITILFQKKFTLSEKAPCNAIILESYKKFDFQPIIYSVPLSMSIFNYNTLNVS